MFGLDCECLVLIVNVCVHSTFTGYYEIVALEKWSRCSNFPKPLVTYLLYLVVARGCFHYNHKIINDPWAFNSYSTVPTTHPQVRFVVTMFKQLHFHFRRPKRLAPSSDKSLLPTLNKIRSDSWSKQSYL